MKKTFNRFLVYFLQGLLFIAPLAITGYAIWWILVQIDNLLTPWITQLLGFRIPGLGLILMICFITLIGILGSSILFKPLLNHLDRLVSRAPVVKVLYSSIKDFMSAFVGKDKKFTEPVLVLINEELQMEKLGFITQKDLSSLGIDQQKVAVYLPHSYNFSGNLFIVPAKNVKPLDASPMEVMKFIVSAGVTSVPGKKSE